VDCFGVLPADEAFIPGEYEVERRCRQQIIPEIGLSGFWIITLALKKRLTKSLYTERWELLLARLKALRKESGLTQAQVAKLMGRPQSLVAKIESGERRLDVCQFIDYLNMLGADAASVVKELSQKK